MKAIADALREKESAKDLIFKVFAEFVEEYTRPAFGSISKRDIDVLLFMKLQDLDIIPMKADIYQVISMLKVTRSKATNLIYESNLRRMNEESLRLELKALLIKPIIEADNNNKIKKIKIEISNPYLRDYIKNELKINGHLSDTSFSSEIITMSINGFVGLVEKQIGNIDVLKSQLISIGAKADTSIGGILKEVLQTAVKKIAGNAGEAIVDNISEYLDPIIGDLTAASLQKLQDLFNHEDRSDEVVE